MWPPEALKYLNYLYAETLFMRDDLDDLAAHGDMERKRKREDAMFPDRFDALKELEALLYARRDQGGTITGINENDAILRLEEKIRAHERSLLPEGAPITDKRRYIDDDFLAQIKDPRYSSEWVGIALRWQLASHPPQDCSS